MKAQAKIIDTFRNIQTRFGEVTINLDKIIHFRQGMVGMPHAQNFCLTAHPDEKHKFYNLLQSSDIDNLCFLTVALDPAHYQSEDSLISASDYKDALSELEFKSENVTMILVATIHNDTGSKKSSISVNLKAPIFIDVQRMEAVQYVFASPRYPLRYFLY
jgi:flagellar assembly factor FliW